MSQSSVCSKCHRPRAPIERKGSLTSYLFVDLHCQCNSPGAAAAKAARPITSNTVSCKNCGKVIQTQRAGSLTSFLLGSMRCKCSSPRPGAPPGSASANGESSLQTRYRPTLAATQKRQAMHTAMRTRSAAALSSDAALVELGPGQTIGGYQLIELVGQGGMGLVYKARHMQLGRIVALKFLAPSMVSERSWLAFKNEARINSSLSHPTICHIYDLGIHQGLPFYAMDFLDGCTLEEIILRDGTLSVGAALEVFSKVAEGLSYAHRRSVVHKDIKPANIMVATGDNGEPEIKILDFGISQLSDTGSGARYGAKSGFKSGAQTRTAREIVGSAHYMSPEQFRGDDLDQRSDVYSLGCSLFEALVGRPPYEGEDFDDFEEAHCKQEPPLLTDMPGVAFDGRLDAVIQKCMKHRPINRYQNANEVVLDMQRLLEEKELQFALDEFSALNEKVEQPVTLGIGRWLPLAMVSTLLVVSAGLFALFKVSERDALKKTVKSEPSTVVDKPYTKFSPERSAALERLLPKLGADKSEPGAAKSTSQFTELSTENLLKATPQGAFFQSFQGRFGKYVVPVPDTFLDFESYKPGEETGVPIKRIPCREVFLLDLRNFNVLRPRPQFDVDSFTYLNGFRREDVQGFDFSPVQRESEVLANEVSGKFPTLKLYRLGPHQRSPQFIEILRRGHYKTLVIQDWTNNDKSSAAAPCGSETQTLLLRRCTGPMSTFMPANELTTLVIDGGHVSNEDIAFISTQMSLEKVVIKNSILTKGAESLIKQATKFRTYELNNNKIVQD